MRVSVIVPVLNEEGCIAETLRALARVKGDKEILVVDGGSTDATREIAEAEGARVIAATRGRGQQMHAGAVAADGDTLWFLHADTIPPADALEEIRAALADPAVAGGNFGLIFDGSTRAAKQAAAIYPVLRVAGLCYGDSGIFVRREVYKKAGGFRALALFEDVDFLRRLRKFGKFVHLKTRICTSSRRFEDRVFVLVLMHWGVLQGLYWCGVPPNLLARWYRHARAQGSSRASGSRER